MFCKLEYLDDDWWVGHGSVNLMNPEKYASKCVRPVRVTVVDTGEIFTTEGYELL